MIPYGRQSIDEDDIQAVLKVLKGDFLTQGPAVAEFEKALCDYTGAKFAVAVSNGTAALHLAYLAAGIGEGDEVITTPNTFVATSNMIIVCGAKPVFCDIRLDTYNIDEAKIEALITHKTKAIVAVDFAGQPCDWVRLREISDKHNLILIDDAAHALGASRNGAKARTFADLSTLSFHPVKSITTGEGGAILTDDEAMFDKMKSQRSHGVAKNEQGFNVMTEMGFNYRITDFQCALGASQLKKLHGFIAKRRALVEIYQRELANIDGIILPKEAEGNFSSWHIFVIRVNDADKRYALHEFLKAKGIGSNFHYPCVYGHPYYRQNGYAETALPNADLYEKTSLTIPLYPNLSEAEVLRICDAIKSFFK